MNVLLVFAHPESRTFNGVLKDAAVQALLDAGHRVEVSDLHRMKFDPVPGWHDFRGPVERGDDLFIYHLEQQRAAESNAFSQEIQNEQHKLAAADLLILQFPLWWYSMPAILKGWIDRVFAYGFAYGGGRWYDTGKFAGKRAMVITTVGAARAGFSEEGLQGPTRTFLDPIHRGVLHFVGFSVLEPFLAFGPEYGSEEGKAEVAARLQARLASIEHELGTPPPITAEFDERGVRRSP
jgi:NAD(P)H dehydrogenase (quinone)